MRERTNDVVAERDVKVTMPDGAVLFTDIYHPTGVEDAPTILERTPYGRRGPSAAVVVEFVARGYRFVLQACRGTDGSGGSHSYFAEAGDGRVTADWIAEQPWFNGSLGTFGGSYMGFTQWALASTKPPHLKAMAVGLSASVRGFSWYPGGSLALEVIIPWDTAAVQFNRGASTPADLSPEAVERRMAALRAGFQHLPLGDALRRLTGEDLELYQQQLEHAGLEDPFWTPLDYHHLLEGWTVPTLLVDGWHDYPLPQVLRDYAALRRSGAPVSLRVGAGGHLGGGGAGSMTDAPLAWFDRFLRDDGVPTPASPVTVDIQGEGGGWRDLEDWPPPADPVSWYLQPSGGLGREVPPPSAPDMYRYDPQDPTPSVGGIGMLTGGAVDNRSLEARPDVLVYTSDPLTSPLLVLGPVEADLWVESNLDNVDFFVRLCDVWPDGRSINVCDGLQRFGPHSIFREDDGAFRAKVALWPAGHRFGPGHRLRVQVSSGSHPVYARNLGTGEPPATATTTLVSDQRVHHSPGRRSSLTLPHAPT
jgi:putative CocE/NonD family hydrolase